jgi:hypothetical protein
LSTFSEANDEAKRKLDVLPLPTVYAYHDQGVFFKQSRWKPRRIACTQTSDHQDAPGIDHVVKLCRDQTSAAALISEVVCHGILRTLGIATLEASLVFVSAAFKRSYHQGSSLGYVVLGDLHFGTVLRETFQPADLKTWDSGFRELLVDVSELIRIWAADCWIMNIDRDVFGNILLAPGKGGAWHIVAADQSDCFLGSGRLSDGSCFEQSAKQGPVSYLPKLKGILMDEGCAALREMVNRIRQAKTIVPEVVKLVPDAWWGFAGVSPKSVIECLLERAERIHVILQIDFWEGARNVTGGRLLGI